jgi:nicotinate dehydrogenase subunit B
MHSFKGLDTERRNLLRGGGMLVVGMCLLGGCVAPRPSQRGSPVAAAMNKLRAPVAGPPDATLIDTWLAIHADSTATLYMGFAELGQGATTALLQVAAEELELGMDQIHAAPLDTHLSPNQGGTYSSAAIQRGRPQVAAAAAQARAALLDRAAQRLGVPRDSLAVERAVVRVRAEPRRTVSYGELIGGERFELKMEGTAPLKNAADYRLVGARLPRTDLAARVDGTHTYIQHLRLPGMLHGRVVRPRGQAAYGAGARVLAINDAALAAIPGARVL